jgi:hypothetical protein
MFIKCLLNVYNLKDLKVNIYLKLGNVYTKNFMYSKAYEHYLVFLGLYGCLYNNIKNSSNFLI